MLSYERLRTMATLVTAVAYFARLELGHTVKLNLLVRPIYQASKRIYGIPEFRFYAIAEGIKQVLFGRQKGIGKPPPPHQLPNRRSSFWPSKKRGKSCKSSALKHPGEHAMIVADQESTEVGKVEKTLGVLFVLLAGSLLLAKDVWEKKPYTEWSEKEALKVCNKSPWVEEKRFRASMLDQGNSSGGGRGGGRTGFPGGGSPGADGPGGVGSPGDDSSGPIGGPPSRGSYGGGPGRGSLQQNRSFFIRLQSAQVMRMALGRLAVLNGRVSGEDAEHYVKTPPYDGKIVVAVSPSSSQGRTELGNATTEFLKSDTYLYLKQSKSRIYLERYVDPAEAGGMEGFFVFPREKKGQEMLAEKEIRFRSKLNDETELKAKFKLKKMVVNGELQL